MNPDLEGGKYYAGHQVELVLSTTGLSNNNNNSNSKKKKQGIVSFLPRKVLVLLAPTIATDLTHRFNNLLCISL